MEVRYHIRMSDELKKSLQEIAEAEGRSLASMITFIFNKYVEEKKNA